MKSKEDVLAIIHADREVLEKTFHVRSMGIFGSTVRGEATEESDIDILVEFDSPVSLFELARLEQHLEDLLGSKVDLVPSDGIKPALRDAILGEVVYA